MYVDLISYNLVEFTYWFYEVCCIISLRFSMQTIMSPVNKDSFISSFKFCMLFLSFSCLITVARTSYTTLNKSPCLVPYLRGKVFTLIYDASVTESGVRLLAAQKPIKRPDWWKGKFALFQMPATGEGRADVCPKADSPPLTIREQEL